MSTTHQQILDAASRTGDVHGNAPRYCESKQYLPIGQAMIFVSGVTAADIRLAYQSADLRWCAKCCGWHA